MVSADKDPSGVGTLIGTPRQVRKGLSRSRAEQVIAFTFEHASEASVRALADTIANLPPIVRSIVERRQNEALRSIIDALVPEVPPPLRKLVEARMKAQARKAVLESGDWLTAAQIAIVAGFSASNPSARPSKWKKAGRIFAVRWHGLDYFPSYALDPSTDHRPARGLAEVLYRFRWRTDSWGLAYWFASVNSFLGGRRPQDLLISQPDRVIAAAEDEIAGALHG